MVASPPSDFNDRLDLFDLSAIAEPDDKVAECEYFLTLASAEPCLQRFRWLISAFLGAAYSFFEISALSAYHTFTDPQTGGSIEDAEALNVLRRYVTVSQNVKNPSFVKTGGHQEVIKQLYELRKVNTHHVPLSIMSIGDELPEDFHFGHITGNGVPALVYCRTVISLIRQVHHELQSL